MPSKNAKAHFKGGDMESKKEMVFKLLVSNLDKKSKFFKDDSLALKKRVSEKTEEELDEALLRWRAILTTTPQEIAKHCQI